MAEVPKLPPPTAEALEAMRAELGSGDPYRQLPVLETVWQYREGAAGLVPDIAALLTSEAYVPVNGRKYAFSGHAPIAQHACSAIESIGVAPDSETLVPLLEDRRIFELPEASYDQGAYIGDYGTDYIAPAAYAARLCELMGADMAPLVKALGWNALAENELIYWPAHRAISRFADVMSGEKGHYDGRIAITALAAVIDALPEVAAPATKRGFALRDLARHIHKKLGTTPSA